MATARIVAFLILFTGCQRLERGKQIRAQGDLQYLVAIVDQYRTEFHKLPSPSELSGRLTPDRLVDPWGNRILYEVYRSGDQERYVLVCVGSDGTLDLESPRAYLDASPRDVSYKLQSDIVVVDGEFVLNAGK